MKLQNTICVLFALGSLSVSAAAQDTAWNKLGTSPTQVTGSIGTQGVGVSIAKTLNSSFDVRVGLSALSYSRSTKGADFDADAKLKLQNLGIYSDYFPIENNGFRLTAGAQFGKNKANITGKGKNGLITVDGVDYAYDGSKDSVTGQLNMGNAAPFLGLGYSSRGANKPGISFSFDAGVRFGKADVSLTRSGFDTLSPSDQNKLDDGLKAEAAKVRKDLKALKTYPVLAVGLSYTW